jgi:K(+)-stimulated pyrophosphate-energized sodium pump
VELAVQLTATNGAAFSHVLAVAFFLVSFFFVWKSFYGMRIVKAPAHKEQPQPELTGSVR